MSQEKSLQIAKAIKNHLIDLAANDNLPLDMTQLDENALAQIVQSELPTDREKAIEKASHYLCEFDDEDGNFVSVEAQLMRIAEHPEGNVFIDNVEGVVVWEPVQYHFDVDDFIDFVGWVD